ncbi:MAG: aminoacyl-histidine dipeptidase [Chitinivibrionia bacterium]|nr:aminoacyl-histidine dipeptidase [Chitinivibrionia bacterium]
MKNLLFLTAISVFIFIGCKKSDTDKTYNSFTDKGANSMVYEYFLELSKIPRCSGREKAISDYLAAFSKKLNLQTFQDDKFNLLVKKNGSKGRENEPAIILQAHIDMVCEKNSDVNHDFSKDPIIPVIKDDWIYAQNKTTLGADNGGGVALIMAILAANNLSHPPIEAVFTSDEEAGMTGAANFDASLLSAARFINLDMEKEGVFTASCASGTEVEIAIPVKYETPAKNLSAYSFAVKGLVGGHSGMDIDKGLANANRLAAQVLNLFEANIHVSEIKGGFRPNAIPRECNVLLLFDESDFDEIKSAVENAQTAFKMKYTDEKNLSLTLEKSERFPESVMEVQSFHNVLDIILQIPNGVVSMNFDAPKLVQTSNNLGVIISDGKSVKLSNFPRSCDPEEQTAMLNDMKTLAVQYGASIKVGNAFPAWCYKANSPLRNTMSQIFTDMYGKEPSIEGVHAGLECGLFAEKMPNVDFISIGPDIEGAHSPDERMSVSSLNRVYDYLVKVLEKL